jgi:serine/threonine protein kinase
LEYLPGGSIRSILDLYGPLKENLIKIYLKQILIGLKYLHDKGIVHRDIKSANILVDCCGIIKLSDFGSAGQILNQSQNDLLTSLKGTLPWMAPEVVRQNNYGKKADIWSLGCLLIEMSTGKIPWGNIDNYIQAIMKIGKSTLLPDIPHFLSDSLKDFIKQCLVRNPIERAELEVLLNHPFLQNN